MLYRILDKLPWPIVAVVIGALLTFLSCPYDALELGESVGVESARAPLQDVPSKTDVLGKLVDALRIINKSGLLSLDKFTAGLDQDCVYDLANITPELAYFDKRYLKWIFRVLLREKHSYFMIV